MGIDWEEMLGAEGDEMAQAYEIIVCDAMALETRDNYYNYDIRDYGVRTKTQTVSKDRKKRSGYLCKVAGVTFDNPDGESRQDVIKAIIDERGDGYTWKGPGELKTDKRKGSDPSWKSKAIEVYVDGKPIGLVPREDKKAVTEKLGSKNFSVTVKLEHYPEHDIYTAKLFMPDRS